MAFNILIVEDHDKTMRNYIKTSEDSRFAGKYEIISAKSRVEALQVLERDAIVHAAIIDLGIPKEAGGEPMDDIGLDFIKDLMKAKWFPVVVVSGNPDILELDGRDIPTHLRVFNKVSKYHIDVFEHFDGIKDLLSKIEAIQSAMDEILLDSKLSFWTIWEKWDEISSCFSDEDDKEKGTLKILLGDIIVNKWMQEYSAAPSVHPSIFYSHPISMDQIFTGDILNIDDEFWVVVTPPCDLSHDKHPEDLTLLKCIDLSEQEKQNIKKSNEENASRAQKEKVKKFFTESDLHRHFIPPWGKGKWPYWVSFKNVKTCDYSELKEKISGIKVASINWRFLPNLMQRFGFYVSRMGQDDIGNDESDAIDDTSLKHLLGNVEEG